MEHPAHPLVAVFQPLMQHDAENLEQDAAGCYNQIVSSGLDEPLRSVLLEVFINWLEQRFVEKGKAEIEKMLVGQLPDLRETQSGERLDRDRCERRNREGQASFAHSGFGIPVRIL